MIVLFFIIGGKTFKKTVQNCTEPIQRATTTTATEEFSAKARPVIQCAQGLNIPFGKPLTPILNLFSWLLKVGWNVL